MNKEPPHNCEIERAVLCGILKDGMDKRPFYDDINPDDFYSAANRRVFEAVLKLRENGIEPERLALITELKKAAKLDEAGGEEYVRSLYDFLPGSANGQFYTNVMLDHSDRRSLLRVAGETAAGACDESKELRGIVDNALRSLNTIKQRVTAVNG